MPLEEAQKLAEQATQGLLDTLVQYGHPLEAGARRLDSKIITQKEVDQFRRVINRAFLTGLKSIYKLIAP